MPPTTPTHPQRNANADPSFWGGLADEVNTQMGATVPHPPPLHQPSPAAQTPARPFWADGIQKGEITFSRLKQLALMVFADGSRWVGVLLPLLIAFPGLKEKVLLVYCAAIALLVAGYVRTQANLIRHGVIGLIALKAIEDFLRLYAVTRTF